MKTLQKLLICILTIIILAAGICTSALADDTVSSNNWGGDMMGLTQVKSGVDSLIDDGTNLPEIKVAVIDTGANTNHVLLKDRILPESKSFINQNTSDISDQNGHGTHVAGIIAQNTPRNVKILILQALDENKKGTAEHVAAAIDYAVQQGADIINLSLGISKATGAVTDSGEDIDEFVDVDEYKAYVTMINESLARAKSSGCLVVAAAGNSEGGRDLAVSQTYPAISDDVITVSAISKDKSLYENSNYGEAVDICAPGEDIYSAGIKSDTALEHLSGTSMAAPFISSSLAVLKLYNPGDTAASLTQKLQSTDVAQDLGTTGKDPQFGYGLPVFEGGSVPHTKLSKPEIKKSTSDGETITLEWDAVNSLTYDVYRRESGATEFTCVTNSLSEGKFVDEDVVLGTSYEYYLEASNGRLVYDDTVSEVVLQVAEVEITWLWLKLDGQYLEIGKSRQLSCSISPSNATNKALIWESSDEAIAKVSSEGEVTGIAKGKATITVLSADRKVSDRKTIHIVDEMSGKCGDKASWALCENETGLTLTILGEGDIDDIVSIAPWNDFKKEINKISIDDRITEIGSRAFASLINVKSVSGMGSVKAIGQDAFSGCTSLHQIDLPETLQTIESGAFNKCKSLKAVSLPEGLQTIAPWVFGNTGLEQIVIPDTVTLIDNSAFSSCSNLTSITLPEGLETIGDSCFDQTGLRTIVIPSTVSSVGEYAFRGTNNLESIQVDENNKIYASQDGVLFDKSIATLIHYPASKAGEYSIPESVTSICTNAFSDCMNITRITIPRGVTVIRAEVCKNCKNLEFVSLPNTIVNIHSNAFSECKKLQTIQLPEGLIEIGSGAFLGSALESIDLPATLVKIGGGAFSYSKLEKIVIPEGVKEIGAEAFSNCKEMKSITLPVSLEVLGSKVRDTFHNEWIDPSVSNCNNLEEVYYTGFTSNFNSITYIRENEQLLELKNANHLHIEATGTINDNLIWKAEGISGDVTLTISGTGVIPDYDDPKDAPWYDGKDEITHVVIEDGVTEIGKNSFFRYSKLQDVTLPNTIEDFGRDTFRDCKELKAFYYIPTGSSDEFRIEPQYLVSLYSGLEITPGVYVSLSGTTLKEGTDYKISYKNNTRIGQAQIKVTFIGNYAGKGTALVPFTITDKFLKGETTKTISSITLEANTYKYNGSTRKPAANVKSDNKFVLKENADYKLEYSAGRKNVGTYKVVASGIGAYTGTKWASFEITPKSISGFSASLSKTSYTYDGKAKKPTVTVSGVSAGNYTVSYANNTEIGTGTVTVSGKGNYTGQKKLTFTITKGSTAKSSSTKKATTASSARKATSTRSSSSTGTSTKRRTASTGAKKATTKSSSRSTTNRSASRSTGSSTTRSRSTGNRLTESSSKKKDKNSSGTTTSSSLTESESINESNDTKAAPAQPSIKKVSGSSSPVKYVAAGLFLTVAAAGTVFLILMLKKKKKKEKAA